MSIKDIVQQMLDKFWPELNEPLVDGKANNLYLPLLVQQQGYDPDAIGSWELGVLSAGGDTGAQICGPAGVEKNETWIGSTSSPFPFVSVSSATLLGVSNVRAETPTAVGDGYTIVAPVVFSELPTHPQSATVTLASEIQLQGNFELKQWCCTTTDFKHCVASPPPSEQVGHGTFRAAIPKSNATMVFEITSLAPGVLNIAVASVTYDIESIAITANITSVPLDQRSHWDQAAEQALNSAEAKSSILSHINSVMNEAGNRGRIATELTKRIDAYLREHDQYPFDQAQESIF